MPCGCAANRAAKLAGATIAQSTASARNISENPGVTSQSTECPGCPLEEIRQRADQAVGSAQAFRDTTSSASPTTRSIEAGQTKTEKPATEVKDSFERIKQDLGAFNLKRYIPKPKDQQEEERKAQSGVQFAEKPPSDGFEVLHDKASIVKKGTSKSDWGNITPCPSLSSRSQSRTQWQQQRSQMPASQQRALTPNVSYVQCNRKSQSKIPQGVAPQRSEPQRPTFNQQQSAPVETLYQTGQQATPREAFNTAFIGQLPTDSQWSPARKKTPCNHCLLHGSATTRDAFNQGFLGQLPPDEQWASKRQQGPSASPREVFNTGFSGQLPKDAQWRLQTPAPQPQRDIFNEAFIGQLPTDNQARPQTASRRPSVQRDVFNEAFIGQLPTDNRQASVGRMAPPSSTPRDVFNQGFIGQLPTDDRTRPQTVCRGGPPKATPREAFNQGFAGQLPTDAQWGNRVNTVQIRSARDIAPPSSGRDVFNEAFVGQLPTDSQLQPPQGRKPPTASNYQSGCKPSCGVNSRDPFNEAFIGQPPTDISSGRRASRETPRDPFNEAFIGQPPTDYQSSSRPPSREKPRDPFNEAFIGQLPKDAQRGSVPPCIQSRSFSTPRDAFNTGFRGQLPTDSQWSSKPTSAPPPTPRDVFNQGFRGQLPTDQPSPPGASQKGYGQTNAGQSNPKLRPCGRC